MRHDARLRRLTRGNDLPVAVGDYGARLVRRSDSAIRLPRGWLDILWYRRTISTFHVSQWDDDVSYRALRWLSFLNSDSVLTSHEA